MVLSFTALVNMRERSFIESPLHVCTVPWESPECGGAAAVIQADFEEVVLKSHSTATAAPEGAMLDKDGLASGANRQAVDDDFAIAGGSCAWKGDSGMGNISR